MRRSPIRQSATGISLLIACLLTACTVIHEPQLPPDVEIDKQAVWETRRLYLEGVQTWSLQGRIAGKSNNEGFRTGVRWQQRQQEFDIGLHGPLGRKVAVINVSEGSVQVNTARGESYSAQDIGDLMQHLFGYSLPLNSLLYWMRGIPDPGQAYASLQLDDQGRLKHLNQTEWFIDYNRYHNGDPALPAFIRISTTGLNANIVIHHWALNGVGP